jgi:teichoic acid transport system permease protein
MSAPTEVTPKHHPANEWEREQHIYEPHVVGLPPILPYLLEAWRRREFAFELAKTKLKATQYNTVFGQLWLVLNPILLAGVYFVLIDIIRGGKKPAHFIVHLVASIFIYYYVSGAIRDGAKSVVKGGRLILNSSFPRLLLPLASVIVAWKKFVPTAIVYVPLFIFEDRPFGPHLLWLFPLLALATMIATGLAVISSTVQVYFRDFAQFLPYALRMMLYTAPVLYFATRVPDRYEFLMDLNPIAQLIAAFDSVLFFGQAPSLHAMIAATVWGIVSLVVGVVLFLSREREFAVRI